MAAVLMGDGAVRIGLFATGGTIAMRADPTGGVSPRDGAAALAAHLALPPSIRVEAIDLFAKPSPGITLADVAAIAAAIGRGCADGLDGIVITHGTDTLEETAFALALMLGRTGRPVVVTGAMRSPDQPGADGQANLRHAILAAAAPAAAAFGVMVVVGGEIHAAHLVRKVHSSRPHAFSSAPFGPIGLIAEDVVRLVLAPASALPTLPVPQAPVPAVPVLTAGLDLEPETVAAFAEAAIGGLVLAGVGGGHVSARAVPALAALAARRPVVITSRTGQGPALRASYAYPGGDIDLARHGLIDGGLWRPAQARILLQLALAAGVDPAAAFAGTAA